MTNSTPTVHAADALIDAVVRLAAPVCVGIDPVMERMPSAIVDAGSSRGSPGLPAAAHPALGPIRSFTLGVLDAVAEIVPGVKFQSACFERHGHAGVAVLEEMMDAARSRGLLVILDGKRGDIGISAEHYAAAAFGRGERVDGRVGPQWVTVNAYLGVDGVRPFLRPGHGAFALVRTSNPGGDVVQGQRLADGRTVAESMADLVAGIGREHVGSRGFSALGAVVGATRPREAERLRERMPQQILLVPGYGAQGGGVEDVRPLFDAEGKGAIVTASRSVIYAGDPASSAWAHSVADAARRLADEVGQAAGVR